MDNSSWVPANTYIYAISLHLLLSVIVMLNQYLGSISNVKYIGLCCMYVYYKLNIVNEEFHLRCYDQNDIPNVL